MRLVVHDATPVQTPIDTTRRFESRRLPVIESTGWLHVVVGVDQCGRRAGPGIEPFRSHVGMSAFDPQDLDRSCMRRRADELKTLKNHGARQSVGEFVEGQRRLGRVRQVVRIVGHVGRDALLEREQVVADEAR